MNNFMLKEKNITNSMRRDDISDKLKRFDNIREYKIDIIRENVSERMTKIDDMMYNYLIYFI